MNVFFIPQLGSMIYTMNGMVTQLKLRADTVGDYQGLVGAFHRRRLSRHAVRRARGLADRFRQLGLEHRAQRQGAERRQSTRRSCCKQSVPKDKPTYRLDDPLLFHDIATQKHSAGARTGRKPSNAEASNAR